VRSAAVWPLRAIFRCSLSCLLYQFPKHLPLASPSWLSYKGRRNGIYSASSSMSRPHRQEEGQQQHQFQATWTEFVSALKSPNDPFNPFVWIVRLSKAAIGDFGRSTGITAKRLLALIPVFAIALIAMVVLSYFAYLRTTIIEERWCGSSRGDNVTSTSSAATATATRNSTGGRCWWLSFHDAIILYFGAMVLFHYLMGTFTSPGVALPSSSSGTPGATFDADSYKWKASEGRGGLLGIDPPLDVAAERGRVSLYGDLADSVSDTNDGGNAPTQQKHRREEDVYPSVDATYCNKCDIRRPPRCHHCRHCNRCVLQFDHHCIWLNNCVGYNN